MKRKNFENTIQKIESPLALNNYMSNELNFLDIGFIYIYKYLTCIYKLFWFYFFNSFQLIVLLEYRMRKNAKIFTYSAFFTCSKADNES
jgi:hypothetical protein